MFLRFEKTTKQTKLANCWGHIKRNPWLLTKTQIYKIGVVSQSEKKNFKFTELSKTTLFGGLSMTLGSH